MVLGYSLKKLLRSAPKSAIWLTGIGLVLVILILFCAVAGPFIVPFDPTENFLFSELLSPNRQNLMGTDSLGRDVFSRMIEGARMSVLVALAAVAISMVVGSVAGVFSGYFGGYLDMGLTAFSDAIFVFPSFILALLLVFALGRGIWQIALAVAITKIPAFFRVMRSQTLSLKERDFVAAEKVIGSGPRHIIVRHILPFLTTQLLVLGSLYIATAIITIAGLGFLGLGISPPTPEWGTDLSRGRGDLIRGRWWLTVFPGLMILITVLAFNLLSEGIDLILNPTKRKR